MITRSEATSLFEIARVWERYYRIKVNDDGVWSAQRLGNATVVITAESPEMLRALIGEDYTQWTREAERHNRT